MAGQERRQEQVQNDRGPQEGATEAGCNTQKCEVESDRCAVGQHTDKRRSRPAGDPETDESDAGYASYGNGDAGKRCAQQQLPDQRRNNQQRQSRRRLGDASESERGRHVSPGSDHALASR
jgi:hypothetical protein